MASDFYMDRRGLDKLERFFKDAPKLIKPVTANILTSLAFETRKYDIQNISSTMTIRNKRFVESSIQVEKARSVNIVNQIARVGSVERPRFSGWREQQTGEPPLRKRTISTNARGGSKASMVKQKYRLKSSNKFYKPEQFQGRDLKSSFQFMMRVLGTRGGGEFILTRNVQTKRGVMGPGEYSFRNHRIQKMQDFKMHLTIKRNTWRTQSLRRLTTGNTIEKIWRESMNRIISRYAGK
jgi:hypothetical protein